LRSFRLETFLEPFDKEFICAYDWVFSDVDSYTFQINDQEGCSSLFDREQFWLTGEALLRHLKHVSTLVIFGLVIAVKKECTLPSKVHYPKLVDHPDYWKDTYTSAVPNQILEIAFFDSTDILITTNDSDMIEQIKKWYPHFINYYG